MSVKVLYFSAGAVPTAGEKAEIVKISDWAAVTAEVHVMNGAAVGADGSSILVADYVAGTVPAAYSGLGYTTLDPDNPPDATTLPDTQTVLSNAEEIALDTAGTVTCTVAGNAITAADVEADESVVTDADTLELETAGTVTFGVAAHVLTGDVAATEAVVAHGAPLVVDGEPATLSIVAHAVTGALASTQKIVSHADAIAVKTNAGASSDDAEAAVVAKALTVALPEDKTVVEDADTVTLDGVSVPLSVALGVLGAATLIASGSTSKVITTGIEIPATGVITTKVTVTIVDGVITACVGG